jgi:hypothetical protein
MVEVLGTPPAPGDARSLTLALAASQQFAGEGPKTRVAGPEPVELSSVWATANPPESGEIPTKLGRTWLPFVYYVRTDCISYEFTASVRAGATGPALSQQSAKFFVPFECH